MRNLATFRATAVWVVCLGGTLLAAQPVFGQAGGEVHAAFLYGGQSDLRFTGIVGGGGVVIRDRFGVDGEFGLTRDNSDERDLAPILGISGNVRLASPKRWFLLRPPVLPVLAIGEAGMREAE